MTIAPSGTLGVIRGLGGNGSTYLSRAIAEARTALVLNECNPRSAHLFSFQLNPLYQLAQLEPELAASFDDFDMAELGSPRRFGEFLDRLVDALAPGRRLVVRDYNLADFVASPLAWNLVPASSLDAALGDRPRAEILLVRDPIDQFLSLRGHRVLAKALTFGAFLRGVLAMLDAFADIPIIRYEALFDDFDAGLDRISAILALPPGPANHDAIAPLALESGNPRGRTSQDAKRMDRDEERYAVLDARKATCPLLDEIRARTGYEV